MNYSHISRRPLLLLLIAAGSFQLSAAVDVEILSKQKARVFKTIKYDFMQKTNNQFDHSRDKRKKIIRFFEEDQAKLLAGTTDPKELEQLKTVSKQWEQLKKYFDTPVTDATITSVFHEEFQHGLSTKKTILDLTKTQLVNQKNKDLFYINNLRAISQKFAITYLVKTVEPRDAMSEKTKTELAITLKKFRTALDYLHKTLHTSAQKSHLEELEKIYIYFNFLSKSRRFTPTLIINKSDEMLQISKELIRHYHEKE